MTKLELAVGMKLLKPFRNMKDYIGVIKSFHTTPTQTPTMKLRHTQTKSKSKMPHFYYRVKYHAGNDEDLAEEDMKHYVR
mmetsp:Transcript_49341/g.59485  ORF Transcript_49341/g.59485 Transcript_49341/m.59485 type:complete len:80 (+) Transcript_49341:130-369(+)